MADTLLNNNLFQGHIMLLKILDNIKNIGNYEILEIAQKRVFTQNLLQITHTPVSLLNPICLFEGICSNQNANT
jgi:hypothetical protein